jgi:hypothetical protein
MQPTFYVAAIIAISSAAFAPLHASAQVSISIIVPTPPPPVIVETAPAPRAGYIWAPGYWSWNGHKHVWVESRWEQVREGYQYASPAWRRHGDQWRFQEGGWKQVKKEKKQNKQGQGNFCPPGQAKKGNCR